MLATCQRLGVPVAQEKCAGPAAVLVFLGFELDTNQMVIRLPEVKLHRTQSLVRDWLGKKACKKRDLESLLGHLQHAATVVHPGRTFVRRLIELVSTVQTQDWGICLSSSTRSDLNWWFVFMERWKRSLHGSKSFNACHPTGDRRLWLLGLWSSLGIMVVAVEMGRSINRVAYLSKGASPNSLCGSGMGRALGGMASGVPL